MYIYKWGEEPRRPTASITHEAEYHDAHLMGLNAARSHIGHQENPYHPEKAPLSHFEWAAGFYDACKGTWTTRVGMADPLKPLRTDYNPWPVPVVEKPEPMSAWGYLFVVGILGLVLFTLLGGEI